MVFLDRRVPAKKVVQYRDEMSEKGHLLRILGLTFGIAVSVGGMIGVGILRTPGLVAGAMGSAWLVVTVWALGGVYAFLGTISVAELGAMLPKAGGWYVYARRAFGRYGGFLVGWCDWIAQSAALAYLSTATAEYAAALWPILPVKLTAIGVLALFALLQWMGLRESSRTQEITSLVKGIGLIAFVVLCFMSGNGNHAAVSVSATPLTFVAIVLALQAVIGTYDGWYTANYFCEEDENPGHNLPRAIIAGILITIFLYLIVNIGILYALPIDRLASSKLPAAAVAEIRLGAMGGKVITALALISLLSVINAVLLLATRILFAMSRDGLFFKKASNVSHTGTPVPAMFITTVVAMILIASGTFEKLLAIAAFLYVIVYNSGFLSLFLLRKREPDLHRPFRVWGYPWTTLIALIVSTGFLVAAVFGDTRNSVYALMLIALSYPAYRVAAFFLGQKKAI